MISIPGQVLKALAILKEHNFQAFIVGGCVRDVLLQKEPKDWDIATNATPEEILGLFESAGYKAFYENVFGTVTVIIDELSIEATPFRKEGRYSDKRHPDEIKWAKTLEEDLARRDFTINAMAMGLKFQIPNHKFQTNSKFQIQNSKPIEVIDLFGGKEDLKKKLVRAVGDPNERFNEDALRLMRACRIATELGFTIEEETFKAIQKNAFLINAIAKERARDEFQKIILTQNPEKGLRLLKESALLAHIIPELEEGQGFTQRGPHRFDIFTHNLFSLKWAAKESQDLVIRLAALFHDIGKSRTRKVENDGKITFYDHPVVGATMTREILWRLRFAKKIVDEVSHLVCHHMFYYDVGKVTPSGVRRLLHRVGGKEIFEKLLVVRRADRRATPVPKTHPYRLRHLEYMVEKVSSDPLSRFQLVVNGDDVKQILNIHEGRRVGLLLNALLVEVLEDPQKNTRDYLLTRLQELQICLDAELEESGKAILKKQKERDQLLKAKHAVI